MCWGETTTAGNQAHPPNQALSTLLYTSLLLLYRTLHNSAVLHTTVLFKFLVLKMAKSDVTLARDPLYSI